MAKSYIRRDGDRNITGWGRAKETAILDEDGEPTGALANEGYTEELPEDHPDVVAFLAGPPEPPTTRTLATGIADAIDAGDTAALRALIAQFPE